LEGDKPKSSVFKNVEPKTYATLYEGFAKAVGGGGESAVPVKAQDARDVLRIIEAAIDSSRSGKTIVL
jgi:predicted dehydrogenase